VLIPVDLCTFLCATSLELCRFLGANSFGLVELSLCASSNFSVLVPCPDVQSDNKVVVIFFYSPPTCESCPDYWRNAGLQEGCATFDSCAGVLAPLFFLTPDSES